jgi:hypothetical protein
MTDYSDVSGRNPKELLRNALDVGWTESRANRETNVPKPAIKEAGGNQDRRAVNYSGSDVIYVQDGGDRQIEPGSVGFRDRRIDDMVDVEIRTSAGVDRLFGPDQYQYSGLEGEVKQIVDEIRFGLGPYDYVWYESEADDSEDYGADTWHARVSISFIAYSQPIKA